MKIVECVVNISEGSDLAKIERISGKANFGAAKLLHVDSGVAAGRTVITFAGPPQDVEEAAFLLFMESALAIDMQKHRGVHPCIGAVDVCPFVPLVNSTLDDCVKIAERVAARVSKELSVPVYLYGSAAKSDERTKLSYLRRGGYQKLAERIADPAMKPDFGEAEFNASFGAAIIGARPIMIAYNITLESQDKKTAAAIARQIRESGYVEGGRRRPGKFKHCQAIGWYIEDFSRAQVSTNLTNFQQTPPHLVFEEVNVLAESLGTQVVGSQIIGLVPKKALLTAGQYYRNTMDSAEGASGVELIEAAINHLQLSNLQPFVPEDRILEKRLKSRGFQICQDLCF